MRESKAAKEEHLQELLSRRWEGDWFFMARNEKGAGVSAKVRLPKDKAVLAYVGTLYYHDSERLHEKYARDGNTGGYIFDFKYRKKPCCIDATLDDGKVGKPFEKRQ